MTIDIFSRPIEDEFFQRTHILTIEFPFALNQTYLNKPLSYSPSAKVPMFLLNSSFIKNHSIDHIVYLAKDDEVKTNYTLLSIITKIPATNKKMKNKKMSISEADIEYLEIYYETKESFFSLKFREMNLEKSTSRHRIAAILLGLVGCVVALLVPLLRLLYHWYFGYLMKGLFLVVSYFFPSLAQCYLVFLLLPLGSLKMIGLWLIGVFFGLIYYFAVQMFIVTKFRFNTPFPEKKVYKNHIIAFFGIYFVNSILILFFGMILRLMLLYCVLILVDFILMPPYASLKSKSWWRIYLVVMSQGVVTQASFYCLYGLAAWLVHRVDPVRLIVDQFLLFDLILLVLMVFVFRIQFWLITRESKFGSKPKNRFKKVGEREESFEEKIRDKNQDEDRTLNPGHSFLQSVVPECPVDLSTLNLNLETQPEREPVFQIPGENVKYFTKGLDFGTKNQSNWVSSNQKLLLQKRGRYAVLNYISCGKNKWEMKIASGEEITRDDLSMGVHVWINNQKRKDLIAIYFKGNTSLIKLISLRRRKVIKQFKVRNFASNRNLPFYSYFNLVLLNKSLSPLVFHLYKFCDIEGGWDFRFHFTNPLDFEVYQRVNLHRACYSRVPGLIEREAYSVDFDYFDSLVAIMSTWVDREEFKRASVERQKYQIIMIVEVNLETQKLDHVG